MYFTKIGIENIKCFGSQVELDLTNSDGTISPWTLILGDNGIGKTTLLKSIAWMVPVEESDIKRKQEHEISKVALKPFMDDFENTSDYEEIVRIGGATKSTVKAVLTNSKLNVIPKSDISYSLTIETNTKGGLKEVTPKLVGVSKFPTTNLFAYAASRHMGLKNFDNTEIQDPTSNLFSLGGDLLDAEQVLLNLDHASRREDSGDKSSELLNKMKRVLVDLLPDVESPENIVVNPPLINGKKNEKIVEVVTPDGKVPLSGLSLGYKTMFAWIVDLGLRMLWSNPDSDDPLSEAAVVLVDEIDLHLHPKWQKIIGNYLRQHFPNTQFICTAHSPVMAQSSEGENIAVLYRQDNEVKVENRPTIVKGCKIGQIVTNLFSISERSFETDELIDERRDLIDQKSKKSLSNQDEQRLKTLDDEIANLPIDNEQQVLLNQINELTKKLL